MLIYLTSGNHSSLTLNLAGPFPVILEKGSSRGKEKANNISGLRRRQGKRYDFIIQEILRIPRGKEGYTLQMMQIKKNPSVGTPFFLVHGALSCPARILSLNLSQNYAPGRPHQLAEIDFVYATEQAHCFHWGNHCAGSGRIGVMVFPICKLCPMAWKPGY